MRFAGGLLSIVLFLAISPPLQADSPRVALKGPPMINGREVREFVLVAPIQVGEKLPPGLPTTVMYEMLPNRFTAACKDTDGIFYQGVGPFQNRVSGISLGGLYVTKKAPVQFLPYTGDASILRMRVSLEASLSSSDLRKIHYLPIKGKK
ncbi:MAG: hypothetical protein QOK24_142 [Verrucomicrobiota bacterium]|jgi:hypothetical protein